VRDKEGKIEKDRDKHTHTEKRNNRSAYSDGSILGIYI
jgi:hypothetical protein